MPKRNSVPSTTKSQYINNSRAGARRKRKHTELKRSGVLERRRHENEAAATLKQLEGLAKEEFDVDRERAVARR